MDSEIFRAPDAYTLFKDLQRFPGQARRFYDLLTAPKALVGFTVAQGARYHDAPMAPHWRNEVIFDWLDQTLGV
jgi:hypothetical protein